MKEDKEMYFKVEADTPADFQKKEIRLENMSKISKSMTEENKKIYHQTVAQLEEPVNIILQALRDKCKDPETAVIFINEFNEALRNKDVK